jgi:hypothetical protein
VFLTIKSQHFFLLDFMREFRAGDLHSVMVFESGFKLRLLLLSAWWRGQSWCSEVQLVLPDSHSVLSSCTSKAGRRRTPEVRGGGPDNTKEVANQPSIINADVFYVKSWTTALYTSFLSTCSVRKLRCLQNSSPPHDMRRICTWVRNCITFERSWLRAWDL